MQAWFVARVPNKLDVMKVRAAWMQSNILNVGWHRSEMERWDEISATGSTWTLEGLRQHHSTQHQSVHAMFAEHPPSASTQPMQVDEQQPQSQDSSQGPPQLQQSRLGEIASTSATLGKQRVVTKE